MQNKYILYWGYGDGCTFHSYNAQPFITNDIDKWHYNFLQAIENAKNKGEYHLTFDNIEDLPIMSSEFSFEILTLEDWFNKFLNN
jgi:hypothetical protein